MPLTDTITAEWAWVIPALSVSAFFITATLGRLLPRQGVYIPIAAIGVGFVIFWFVLADLVSQRGANGRHRLDRSWRYADILGRHRRPAVGVHARPRYLRGAPRSGVLDRVHEGRASHRLVLRRPRPVRRGDAHAGPGGQSDLPVPRLGACGSGLVPAHRILVGEEIGRGGGEEGVSSRRGSGTSVC